MERRAPCFSCSRHPRKRQKSPIYRLVRGFPTVTAGAPDSTEKVELDNAARWTHTDPVVLPQGRGVSLDPRLEREGGSSMKKVVTTTRRRPDRAPGRPVVVGTSMAIGLLFAFGGAAGLSLPATSGGGLNAAQLAAKTFSTKLCTPKNPAAVKGIPKAESGFTGYKESPGNWLALPAKSDLTGHTVALTTMGLNQPFFTSIAGYWTQLAARYHFTLKVYDGQFLPGTVQSIVESLVQTKPYAVAFAALSSAAAVPQVKELQAAGIHVITYNVQPSVPVAPRVFANDWAGAQLAGCNAGRYWLAKFGNRKAVIGIVGLPSLPQTVDRADGMLYGFKSEVANATVVANLNGGAVIDQADTVAAGMLEAHPNINVMLGINDDTAFGIEAALKAAGDWNANWGLIGTTDGGPPAMSALASPNTPWKFESGYPPKDFAYAAFNLLNAQVAGKATKNTQVILSYPPISAANTQAWLKSQYAAEYKG